MKKIFIAILILISVNLFSQSGSTYMESFDEYTYWSAAGNFTDYNAKEYINDVFNPVNDRFISNNAIREHYHINTGRFAWRIKDEAGAYLMYESEETIQNFSFSYRKIDNGQDVSVTVEYSTNSGGNWSELYSFVSDSPVYAGQSSQVNKSPAAPGDKLLIRMRTTSGGVIFYDDVNAVYEIAGLPPLFPTTYSPHASTYPAAINCTITGSQPALGDIRYTTDGSVPIITSPLYVGPFPIVGTTTVKSIVFATAVGFVDSPSNAIVYNIIAPIDVPTIADLRTKAADNTTLYRLTGEAVITYQQAFRNQKYIQDATAAILVDDAPVGTFLPGMIDPTNQYGYTVGDGITGLTGTLLTYHGMLEFKPVVDPGAPSQPASYSITPTVITLDQMNNNFEDYEAQLVKVEDVAFVDAGATFAKGLKYGISDPSKGNSTFKTSFYDTDYIPSTIPAGQKSIIGLLNEHEGDFITSRSSNDITDYVAPDIPLNSKGIIFVFVLLIGVVVIRKNGMI